MASSNVVMPPLTIPNGAAVSNIVNSRLSYDDAVAITLYAPAALDALTFTIEVCNDPYATAASTWRTYQIGDPAADAAPPAAGKARDFYELSNNAAFRIKASGNVAADRTWQATKAIDI